jgi:hypothetical protein
MTTNHERRNAVALDEAVRYCRRLEANTEQPELFMLCNAIRTLDLALEGKEDSPIPMSLCTEAWMKVRDSLFDVLVSSFPGRFEVRNASGDLVEMGDDWPSGGTLSFYPRRISRRNDSYDASLDRMQPFVITAFRWAFADHRADITPPDFDCACEQPSDDDQTADEAYELIERMYEACEEQAQEGKKKAHRKWWQLYWEANSCPNKRQKHQLQKQMVALEGLWGKPAEK